ncbi:GYF domain protein [Aspergillus sp. HF37]|nr:GYF domain protein [Aspergillus sp. HF37]
MARQKEHLAQQQALMKQMQMQGVSHGVNANAPQLQHHSSAHSLHSQPSFGSLTSPLGYQPSPIQGPMQQQQQPSQGMPGLLDAAGSMRQNSLPNVGPQMIGTDMGSGQDQLPALLDRLNVNRPEPFAFGSPSLGGRQPENAIHSQQVATMLQDRARLQQEQEQFDSAHGDSLFDQQAREERLRQFHALRTQEGESGLRTAEGLPTHPATGHNLGAAAPAQQVTAQNTMTQESEMGEPGLSLSQQVQKAASAQRQQQEEEQQSHVSTEVAWTSNNESGMPRPFPPPPSASPLPAPAAQRNRQNVAESLAANSRSQTQTPVEAPATTIAPWAREANEVPKGPSLKEIQEGEARNAAQKEEVAAAARRAQLLAEQERISQTQAPAPGLPSTANWASGTSTASPAPASVWNNKGPSTAASGARKTLAQIQKEEETRKQRMVAATAAATQNAAPSPPAAAASTVKRYADLAGKSPVSAPSPAPAAGSGAWTTVGAGGKPKAPPVSSPAPRATSGNIPAVAAAPKPKPVAAAPRTVSASITPPSNSNRALEEFTKWAKLSLGRGLNSDINVDDFVQQLLLLPAEAEIISDSVYANSQTLDGRRFAEEFIRRRKLADKGIVDPVAASAFAEQKNGGEWSEVAKKGSSSAPREDDSNAAFRVVAPRKKGKR